MLVTRIMAGLMVPALLLSIGVQYNDPDGPLWMAIYAFPLALAILALVKRVNVFAPLGAAAYGLAFAVWMPWGYLSHVPEYVSTVHMTSQESEWAREAIGLLICAVWMVFPAVTWWRQRRASAMASE
ncbi:MAG: hypothetical protein GC168_02080 [Candidatus Hydrogenedens sp.]|nr:hypothetical protein [Candidatus Hydrogenedens sp.]